jgi:8-oxo-dGTP pyrophosphatase MutT (NUDIX family)
MHENDLWQVFSENGSPVPGKGASKKEFEENTNLIMGNAHIWFWKTDGTTTKIMLQKRAANLTSRPGWYHISAGGHINVDETPVEAAVREAKEEMHLDIDTDKLYFVYSLKLPSRDIVNVFLYRLEGSENILHTDGEVDSFEWRTLENWKEIIADAEKHNLVPQGERRFGMLTDALEALASR